MPRGKSGHIGEKLERKKSKSRTSKGIFAIGIRCQKMTFNNSRKSNKVIKSAAAVFFTTRPKNVSNIMEFFWTSNDWIRNYVLS